METRLQIVTEIESRNSGYFRLPEGVGGGNTGKKKKQLNSWPIHRGYRNYIVIFTLTTLSQQDLPLYDYRNVLYIYYFLFCDIYSMPLTHSLLNRV